jgi:hypothetical protein
VEKVSSLSLAPQGGLVLQSKDGKKIYYFGGYPNNDVVHKFDLITNVAVRLTTVLPSSLLFAGGVSMNGKMFLFDGNGGNVLEFSEETESARIIAELSFFNVTSTVYSVTAFPDNKDGIWLFAGNAGKPTYPILQFNTTTNTVHVPNADTTTLRTLYAVPTSVRDSSHGYLIGGIGRVPEGEDGTYQPSNGIVR